MATFKDSNGKEWQIKLDAPKIRNVRSVTCDHDETECRHRPGVDKQCTGVDLAALDGKAYQRMTEDFCLLGDVVWLLVEDQAVAAGVSDVQFGEALVGDAIDGATAAMLAGIADFFPQGRRTLMKAVAEKSDAMRELGTAKALARIEDPALSARIAAALEKQLDEEIERALTRLNNVTAGPAL